MLFFATALLVSASVHCGGHHARTCSECGPDRAFCNGECSWKNGSCHYRGVANAGRACAKSDDEFCGSHGVCGPDVNSKSVWVCQARQQCGCKNGTPVSYAHCEVDEDWCAMCDAGSYLPPDGTQCVMKQCSCKYGIPVAAYDCPTNGQERCASCESGKAFYMDPDSICRKSTLRGGHVERLSLTAHETAEINGFIASYLALPRDRVEASIEINAIIPDANAQLPSAVAPNTANVAQLPTPATIPDAVGNVEI